MFLLKIWYHICAYAKYILLKIIYGKKIKIGKRVTWRQRFNIMISSDAKVEIGDDCFFNNDCSINANNYIRIGSGTIFGENVKIYDHNHRFREANKSIKKQGYSNGEIIIGEGCWIGSNVTLLKGCSIGDNSVVAAGVVLSESVPAGTIVKQSSGLLMEKIDFC